MSLLWSWVDRWLRCYKQVAPLELPNQSAPGPLKSHPTANAWTRPGWNGPLARPAGLPARLSGEGRTGGTGLRWQKELLTRSVRRVAGRYGPVDRATFFRRHPPKTSPGRTGCEAHPLHPSPIELALRSLRSFVASKTLCLSLPSPPKASAIRATHCAPEPYSLVRENSCNPCQPMLAANAFLKINRKKVTDTLAAYNPVFPNRAILVPD